MSSIGARDARGGDGRALPTAAAKQTSDLGAQSVRGTPIAIPGPWHACASLASPTVARPFLSHCFVDAPHERLIVPTSAVGGGPARRAVRRPGSRSTCGEYAARRRGSHSRLFHYFQSVRDAPAPSHSPGLECERTSAPATIDEIRHAKRINMHIDTSADLSADRSTSL